MLRLFGLPVACSSVFFGVQSIAKFETGKTFCYLQTVATTPNNVAGWGGGGGSLPSPLAFSALVPMITAGDNLGIARKICDW